MVKNINLPKTLGIKTQRSYSLDELDEGDAILYYLLHNHKHSFLFIAEINKQAKTCKVYFPSIKQIKSFNMPEYEKLSFYGYHLVKAKKLSKCGDTFLLPAPIFTTDKIIFVKKDSILEVESFEKEENDT